MHSSAAPVRPGMGCTAYSLRRRTPAQPLNTPPRLTDAYATSAPPTSGSGQEPSASVDRGSSLSGQDSGSDSDCIADSSSSDNSGDEDFDVNAAQPSGAARRQRVSGRQQEAAPSWQLAVAAGPPANTAGGAQSTAAPATWADCGGGSGVAGPETRAFTRFFKGGCLLSSCRQVTISKHLCSSLQNAQPGATAPLQLTVLIHSSDWGPDDYLLSRAPTATPAAAVTGLQEAAAGVTDKANPAHTQSDTEAQLPTAALTAAATAAQSSGDDAMAVTSEVPSAVSFGPWSVSVVCQSNAGLQLRGVPLSELRPHMTTRPCWAVVLQEQVSEAAVTFHIQPVDPDNTSRTTKNGISLAGHGPGLQVFPGSVTEVDCATLLARYNLQLQLMLSRVLVLSQLGDISSKTNLSVVLVETGDHLDNSQTPYGTHTEAQGSVYPTKRSQRGNTVVTTSRYNLHISAPGGLSAFAGRTVHKMSLTTGGQLTLHLAPTATTNNAPAAATATAAAAAAARRAATPASAAAFDSAASARQSAGHNAAAVNTAGVPQRTACHNKHNLAQLTPAGGSGRCTKTVEGVQPQQQQAAGANDNKGLRPARQGNQRPPEVPGVSSPPCDQAKQQETAGGSNKTRHRSARRVPSIDKQQQQAAQQLEQTGLVAVGAPSTAEASSAQAEQVAAPQAGAAADAGYHAAAAPPASHAVCGASRQPGIVISSGDAGCQPQDAPAVGGLLAGGRLQSALDDLGGHQAPGGVAYTVLHDIFSSLVGKDATTGAEAAGMVAAAAVCDAGPYQGVSSLVAPASDQAPATAAPTAPDEPATAAAASAVMATAGLQLPTLQLQPASCSRAAAHQQETQPLTPCPGTAAAHPGLQLPQTQRLRQLQQCSSLSGHMTSSSPAQAGGPTVGVKRPQAELSGPGWQEVKVEGGGANRLDLSGAVRAGDGVAGGSTSTSSKKPRTWSDKPEVPLQCPALTQPEVAQHQPMLLPASANGTAASAQGSAQGDVGAGLTAATTAVPAAAQLLDSRFQEPLQQPAATCVQQHGTQRDTGSHHTAAGAVPGSSLPAKSSLLQRPASAARVAAIKQEQQQLKDANMTDVGPQQGTTVLSAQAVVSVQRSTHAQLQVGSGLNAALQAGHLGAQGVTPAGGGPGPAAVNGAASPYYPRGFISNTLGLTVKQEVMGATREPAATTAAPAVGSSPVVQNRPEADGVQQQQQQQGEPAGGLAPTADCQGVISNTMLPALVKQEATGAALPTTPSNSPLVARATDTAKQLAQGALGVAAQTAVEIAAAGAGAATVALTMATAPQGGAAAAAAPAVADADMIDLTADDGDVEGAVTGPGGVAVGNCKAVMPLAAPVGGMPASPSGAAGPGVFAATAAAAAAAAGTPQALTPPEAVVAAHALLPAGCQLPDASDLQAVEHHLLVLLDQLSASLTPQQHLSLMRRVRTELKPLRDAGLSDRRVLRVMCEYRYLRAELMAGGQLGPVLEALEGLLQVEGQQ